MVHRLNQTQVLPININQAWDFFTRPENLNEITPPDLKFKIVNPLPEKIYAGLMITYKLKLLNHIPLEWLTEITHVEEGQYFVDEQRVGPYAIWHHEHHFQAIDTGTLMTDIIHYRIPLGRIGNLLHKPFVKPQLTKIFDYRQQVLEKMFSAKN